MIARVARWVGQPMQSRHFVFAGVLLIAYWFFMLWGAGYYLVSHAILLDLTIPLNAAVMWRDDLALHREINSAFGLFYFLQYGWALSLVEFFIADYSMFAVLTTANVLMLFLALALMWASYQFLQIVWPLWLLLLTILIITANAMHTIGWYEVYNTHLLPLYLLGVFVVWQRYAHRRNSGYIAETVILSLLFVFAALYKINFALAVLCLFITRACVVMAEPSWREIVKSGKLIALFMITVTVLLAVIVLLTGYDISAYLQDVSYAAAAKKHKELYLAKLQVAIMLLPLAAISFYLSWRLFRYPYHWLNLLIWWGGFWLGVLLCISGINSQLPSFLYAGSLLAGMGAWLHWRQSPAILRLIAAAPVAVVMCWMLLMQGWQVATKAFPAVDNYLVYADKPFDFVVPAGNKIKMSRLLVDTHTAPTAEFDSGRVFVDKVQEVGQIVQRWQEYIKEPRVSFMGYENFGWFFYDWQSSDRLHWKHIFSTLKQSDHSVLDEELQASNIVLVPAYFVLPEFGYAPCWFLSAMDNHFLYVQKTKHWHVFVRRETTELAGDKAMLTIQYPAVKKQCDEILRMPPQTHAHSWTILYPLLEKVWDFFAPSS